MSDRGKARTKIIADSKNLKLSFETPILIAKFHDCLTF
uniref:Uncharacterized protein n=1 Tax=Rhizophora mucronata TaxID=61149 RepID=A0A2P2PK05_RHIMU